MNKEKIFACTTREEWRKWLSEHFETEDEVWFVFPTKVSGEPGVSYNDAVEEALCFGWIDGQAGTLDETHQLHRITLCTVRTQHLYHQYFLIIHYIRHDLDPFHLTHDDLLTLSC